jgi:hypothetical protein
MTGQKDEIRLAPGNLTLFSASVRAPVWLCATHKLTARQSGDPWACGGVEHPGWVGGNGFQRSLTFGVGLGWRKAQPEWKSPRQVKDRGLCPG